MFDTSKLVRIGVLCGLATILAVVLLMTPAPDAEAGGLNCNSSNEFPNATWEYTSAAAARTAAGDCLPGEVCKELCISYCNTDQVFPQGQFSCFAP